MIVDRIVGIAILLAITLIPVEYLAFVTIPEVQLILGTLVVLYLLLRDPISGLLFGAALLLAYFRVYAAKYGFSWKNLVPQKKDGYPMTSLVSDYVTPEHLESAQSNVVSPEAFSKSVVGVEGVYGEPVYSAQAINQDIMPGFDGQPLGQDVVPK